MIRFKCERCGITIKCDDAAAGKRMSCSACKHKLLVPRRPAGKYPRLLLAAGGLAGLVIIAWAVLAATGSDAPEKSPEKTISDQSRGSEPTRQAGERARRAPGPRRSRREATDDEIKRRQQEEEKRRKGWEADDAARRIQQEIDRAKWIADMKAKQKKEDEERRRELEEERRREKLQERAPAP